MIETAEKIWEVINQQVPFVQSLIAAGVFALAVFFVKLLHRGLCYVNKSTREQQQKDIFSKHWVHKNFVNTNGLYFFTQGYLLIISKALDYALLGVIVLCGGKAIFGIINESVDFLGFMLYAFVVQIFWEGRSWLIDRSDPKVIERINPELRKELLKEYGNPRDDLESLIGKNNDKEKTEESYRDREEPHSSPLPHHAAYGSVLRDSADPRQVQVQGNKRHSDEK